MSRRVALVGATGAVGAEFLTLLADESWVGRLELFASPRSAGRQLRFRDHDLEVAAVCAEKLTGFDVVLFAAGASVSREYAPAAAAAGALVVDNSSAFRLDPEVPLVVPECNLDAATARRGAIVANPNCSTIVLVLGLAPLARAVGLRRVLAATYQAASGAGQKALDELHAAARAQLQGEPFTPEALPHSLGFNLFPRVDVFTEQGYTREEDKMLHETRKILGLPELPVEATCVRVPVERCHSEAVTVELERPLTVAEAHRLWDQAPGIVVHDRPEESIYPQPAEWAGRAEVAVGRVRPSRLFPTNGLSFWLVGDQLLKGAALNAVQIARALAEPR